MKYLKDKIIFVLLSILLLSTSCESDEEKNKRQEELNNSLMEAVLNDNYDETEKLIKAGADINAMHEDQELPILISIENENNDISGLLIDNGADINAKGHYYIYYEVSPLMAAVHKENMEIVNILLSSGADVNARDSRFRTALMYAADEGNPELVKLLCKSGADINMRSRENENAFTLAVYKGDIAAVKYITDYGMNLIDTVNADSTLQEGETSDYIEFNLINETPDSWSEGEEGSGIGVKIKFTFKRTMEIDFVNIKNGFGDSEYFKANNRVKELRVSDGRGNSEIIELEDTDVFQKIRFENVYKTDYLEFEILEVYRGSRWDDTCIDEISFYDMEIFNIDRAFSIAVENGYTEIAEYIALIGRLEKFITFFKDYPEYSTSDVYWTCSHAEQTEDGGYIAAGKKEGEGWSQIYVFRTDYLGSVLWDITYSDARTGECIKQTADGGFILVGNGIENGDSDIHVYKLDSSGNVVWHKTFGEYNSNEICSSVVETGDGGYMVAGNYKDDVYVLRLNPEGEEIWSDVYVGDSYETAMDIEKTSDGNYIITGETRSFGHGSADVYLLKIDMDGNELWQKAYGTTFNDCGNDVIETSGGYVVIGITGRDYNMERETYSDIYMVYADFDGNLHYTESFGGEGDETGAGILKTEDHGYIIAGTRYNNDYYDSEIYLLKLNSDGFIEWDKTFKVSGDSSSACIRNTADGGYIVAGNTEGRENGYKYKNIYLIKMDSEGRVEEYDK
jgi:ankyrin repeat protein